MRLRAAALRLILLLGCTPSSSQFGSARVTPPPEAGAPPEVLGLPTPVLTSRQRVFDQQFIDAMVPHHQLELELAKVVIARAQHEELRTLAQEIVDAQTIELNDMLAWREEWFGSRATPPMGGAAEISALQAAPDPIDTRFIDTMLPLRQQAAELANRAILEAGHQDILDLSAELLADYERQTQQLTSWRAQWGP